VAGAMGAKAVLIIFTHHIGASHPTRICCWIYPASPASPTAHNAKA